MRRVFKNGAKPNQKSIQKDFNLKSKKERVLVRKSVNPVFNYCFNFHSLSIFSSKLSYRDEYMKLEPANDFFVKTGSVLESKFSEPNWIKL